MATSKPRARRKASDNPAASLIAALKFIQPAQKKIGSFEQQFCILRNHWAVACDGILTIATKIEEDLQACPHTIQLLDALGKCKDDLAISQLSNVCLSVKSGNLNALVQCAEEMEIGGPDPDIAKIDNRIKDALANVMVLATEGAPNPIHASVMLQAGSAVATNGHALVEYWHGVDLPPAMLLPRQAVSAIVKAAKNLVGFGYSGSSATFHFEDGSFIKTQLYNAKYPDYLRLLNVPTNAFPLPKGFFSAVHAIESFNENGTVYFKEGVMSSNFKEGSTYKVEGLTKDMAFNSKYLIMLELCIQRADFQADQSQVIFYGENARGIIKGLQLEEARAKMAEEETTYQNARPVKDYGNPNSPDLMEDDIPF